LEATGAEHLNTFHLPANNRPRQRKKKVSTTTIAGIIFSCILPNPRFNCQHHWKPIRLAQQLSDPAKEEIGLNSLAPSPSGLAFQAT